MPLEGMQIMRLVSKFAGTQNACHPDWRKQPCFAYKVVVAAQWGCLQHCRRTNCVCLYVFRSAKCSSWKFTNALCLQSCRCANYARLQFCWHGKCTEPANLLVCKVPRCLQYCRHKHGVALFLQCSTIQTYKSIIKGI